MLTNHGMLLNMLNLRLSYVNRYEQLLLNPVHAYCGLRPSSKQHVFFWSCKSHCAQLSSCARKPLRHSSPCISQLARATHLLPQLFSETTVNMQCLSFQRWVVNPQSFCSGNSWSPSLVHLIGIAPSCNPLLFRKDPSNGSS